jgi:Tol biopolymer transport system component/tRNA A-37 threonylcarbamoyl transferase component Bud32
MSTPTSTRHLGPYQLIAPIGKGGMGEVWKARDPRLGRDVAIKMSAQQFTDRFEREARAIAALNHPNICTLHDIGPNYLVMELVEGPTLGQRISQGPIPLEEALAIARQIADALDAAHEKNIVHRDLKPANVKVRPDGSVKVLDFGLAKAGNEEPGAAADSPTLLSDPGMILGTAGYMSPEQARGQTVDKRTDIWAFGVVLYEIVTGGPLFEGPTVADTIAAVLTREPDFGKVPEKVRRLLRKCLEKDPRKRLRDIGDWVELLNVEESSATVPSESRLGMKAAWAMAAIAVLAFAVLLLVYFRERLPEAPVVRTIMPSPENTTFSRVFDTELSQDGRRAVFNAITKDGKSQLWVRPLNSLTAQPLPGTEGGEEPFWSPDGQSIGFFARGKLNRMDVAGGPALPIADAVSPRGASWGRQGTIVFAPRAVGPLRKVSISGGAADATNTGVEEDTHRWPCFLPDGRHFLFAAGNSNYGQATIRTIRLGSLDTPESVKLLEADSNAIFSSGYVLFLRGDTLMAQPFDERRLALSGEAIPVVEGVQQIASARGAFSASQNGVLAYTGGGGNFELTWFDRKGNREKAPGDPARLFRMNFAPDRKRAAVTILDQASTTTHIWIYDIARGLRTRFAVDTASERDAVWSADGRTIVFSSNRKGRFDLYRKFAEGVGLEELVYEDMLDKTPMSISPDGKSLLYFSSSASNTGRDLWILPDPLGAPGSAKPYPYLQTHFDEWYGQFSPDGHWIAYQSDESGRQEIYVAPFPGPGGKRHISTSGGTYPRWRGDGKEIFYIDSGQRLTAAEVTIKGGEIETGELHPLFGPLITVAFGNWYDVSADGQRILAIMPQQNASEPLTLVQNWTAGLKK